MRPETHQARPTGLGRSTLLAGCVCALLAGHPAEALELGEPVLRSTLGQRLDLLVPYRVWGNERLTAECVSLVRGDNGIPALTAGRIVSAADGQLVIRSTQGIREPLLALNVKVDCPSTPFIVRSYTVIVDPPGFAAAPSDGADFSAGTPARAAETTPAPRPAAAAKAAPLFEGSRYRVRAGDTLSGIAARIEGRRLGVWATATQIFEANPDAFIAGDMDRLKAGSLLSIPGRIASTTAPVSELAEPARAEPQRTSDEAVLAPNRETPARTTLQPPAPSTAAAPRIQPPVARPAPAARDGVSSSPFKDAGDGAGLVMTESGPAPRRAAPQPEAAPTVAVSPLFAALFGAGIGLILSLIVFRNSIRDLFRRPPPAVVPGVATDFGRTSTHPLGAETAFGRHGAGAEGTGDTDVISAPGFTGEDSMIVSEGEWDEMSHSQLRSLDMDIDPTGERVITERELAVARMSFPAGDDSEFVEEKESPADEEMDPSMIVEVDTGAELAAEASGLHTPSDQDTVEATGLATAVDLEMLEEDYEQEFTATQRLAKQLADAALALDHDLSDAADDTPEDDHEADEGALLETAEMLARTLTAEDVDADIGDSQTSEMPAAAADDETLAASRTTRLPSADEPFAEDHEESQGETASVPLGKQRRA